jgi:hypothetical protein
MVSKRWRHGAWKYRKNSLVFENRRDTLVLRRKVRQAARCGELASKEKGIVSKLNDSLIGVLIKTDPDAIV